MSDQRIRVVTPEDNVATVLRDVSPNEQITVVIGDRECHIEVREAIEFGHKIAIEDIAAGDAVYKYGKPIGDATDPISAGEWVHVHNVESNYGRGDRSDAGTNGWSE